MPPRRARRRGRRDPLPEANDLYDFSDDEEEDPEDDDEGGTLAAASDDFTRRTGVRLHHRREQDDAEDGERQEAKGPVETRVALRALPLIGRTVMAYPEAVRGGLLRHMHLYGRFQMRGIPFLGCALHRLRRINLAIRSRTPPESLVSTLHHEIAHLVELHDDFPEARWVRLSRGPYLGVGHRDIEGRRAGPELWSQGFITRYASKNRHEDFAELAEAAFTTPRRVRQLARDHEPIREKLELMAEAYQRLVPGIDLPWLRREAP